MIPVARDNCCPILLGSRQFYELLINLNLRLNVETSGTKFYHVIASARMKKLFKTCFHSKLERKCMQI